MIIRIHDIGVDGKHISADSSRESWLAGALAQGLAELFHRDAPAHLSLDCLRIGETVQLSGQLELTIYPVCARCADPFAMPLAVPIKRVMVSRGPAPTAGGRRGEEELNAEDLDFSTYEGDELEIDPICVEELLLALPIVFLCRPDCCGLCPCCGANLNLGVCPCGKENPP